MDEGYYINDALSINKYGYEVGWIEKGSSTLGQLQTENIVSNLLSGGKFQSLSLDYNAMHPPFGKQLIALGLYFFGSDSTLGWRISAIIAGTILVVLSMVLAYILFRSQTVALIAGTLVAIDPMAIAMSRVSLLDIFLSVFVMLGAVFVSLYVKEIASGKGNQKILFLMLSSVSLGLASSIKWSGLYFFVAFIIFAFTVELSFIIKHNSRGYIKFILSYVLASVLYVVSYIATWFLWFSNYAFKQSNNLVDAFAIFISEHVKLFNFHTGLSALHNYNSRASEWVLMSRPTFLYSQATNTDSMVFINTTPNLIFWGLGLLACVGFIVIIFNKLKSNFIYLVPVVAIIAGWFPWVLSSGRTIFQYYAVVFLPFVFIVLSFVIVFVFKKINASYRFGFMRMPLAIIIVLGVSFSAFMYSGATGMEVNENNSSYTFAAYWQNMNRSLGFYDDSQMPLE